MNVFATNGGLTQGYSLSASCSTSTGWTAGQKTAQLGTIDEPTAADIARCEQQKVAPPGGECAALGLAGQHEQDQSLRSPCRG